jgi:ubiquinone/menaquinone biosynthesis C-methylase UbiE
MNNTMSNPISEQQKEIWNKYAPGWDKWDNLTMDISKPAGDAMIHSLYLKGDENILDIACGTGEPGLTMARILKKGKVTGIDQAQGMLAIAKAKADRLDIKSYETRTGEASRIPFPNGTFDAVTCRYGFMFFPDMGAVTNEIYRVLAPGGRVAIAVWDKPEKNPWVIMIMGTIMEKLGITPPPPGGPGMFRCAEKGMMAALFQKSGFVNVSEGIVAATLNIGTAQNYWDFMTEVGAAIVVALSKATPGQREEIKNEVIRKTKKRYPEEPIAIAASSLVIYGEKN